MCNGIYYSYVIVNMFYNKQCQLEKTPFTLHIANKLVVTKLPQNIYIKA